MDPRGIILQEYGGSRNMLTPGLMGYYALQERSGWQAAAELSQGTGIHDAPIFGVSVARRRPDGTTDRPGQPFSQMFHSLAAAKRHIKKLEDHPELIPND